MNDKLGSYITKLMTTVLDKEQEEFVKNLALSELKTLRDTLSEFVIKRNIKTEEYGEKQEKQLIQEDKKNGKK